MYGSYFGSWLWVAFGEKSNKIYPKSNKIYLKLDN